MCRLGNMGESPSIGQWQLTLLWVWMGDVWGRSACRRLLTPRFISRRTCPRCGPRVPLATILGDRRLWP